MCYLFACNIKLSSPTCCQIYQPEMLLAYVKMRMTL